MAHRRWIAFFSIGLLLPLLAVSSTPAGASGEGDYCVTEIIGQEKDGEYVLTDQECFETLEELESEQSLMGALILAIHWDNQNQAGPNIRVMGSVLCGGGFINWTTAQGGAWNNRFESLTHSCGAAKNIKHFDNAGNPCPNVGATINTFGSLNTLGAMNNATSCVVYGA